MKVLDNQGRFQFIKNQQVQLDKSLKKYKELEIIKQAAQAIPGDQDTPVSTIELMQKSDVDAELRELIEQLTSNNILQYLHSDNASDFNKKFKKILNGEVKMNEYTLQVTNSRWVPEYTPTSDSKSGKPMNFSDRVSLFFKNIGKAIDETKKTVKGKQKREEDSLSILEFFSTIHVMSGKEKEFINRIEGYFQLYANACKMNQVAQMDEIAQKIIIDIYESVLFVNGYNKYIEFGELEHIKSPGARIVDIDYIANYNKAIPDDVVDKKVKCDEMCVFDNYCVMYYDPSGSTYKATAAARRDPILFGLINHSNKLYFIADWVDENCDLTLEKLAEKCSVKQIQ